MFCRQAGSNCRQFTGITADKPVSVSPYAQVCDYYIFGDSKWNLTTISHNRMVSSRRSHMCSTSTSVSQIAGSFDVLLMALPPAKEGKCSAYTPVERSSACRHGRSKSRRIPYRCSDNAMRSRSCFHVRGSDKLYQARI